MAVAKFGLFPRFFLVFSDQFVDNTFCVSMVASLKDGNRFITDNGIGELFKSLRFIIR